MHSKRGNFLTLPNAHILSFPTGTAGWYVSYNATRGISIFKVERDNEYIKKMLLLLKLFKTNNGRKSFQKFSSEFEAFTNASVKKSNGISKFAHVLPKDIQHMQATMRWFQ